MPTMSHHCPLRVHLLLSLRRILPIVIALMPMHLTDAAQPVWQPTTWQGEQAWMAWHGDALAIVSVERSRLVYFGCADGSFNMISNAPEARLPSFGGEAPWGGHVAWMLHEGTEFWQWPPWPEWEWARADTAMTDGNVLLLAQPHWDKRWPQLMRSYQWTDEGLRCQVYWRAVANHRFLAITTFHVRGDALVRFDLGPRTATAPNGYVTVWGFDIKPDAAESGFEFGKEHGIAAAGPKPGKIGIPEQDLVAIAGKWQLTLKRERLLGTPASDPFSGHVTHLYVAPRTDARLFVELEQLTPFLDNEPGLPCGISLLLKLDPVAGDR